MEHLDASQHQQLDDALARRQQDLQAAIGQLRGAISAPAGGTGPEVRDSVEDGDARMMATLDLTQLGRHEHELAEVNAARVRMREGLYGRCEACDAPIPLQRLEIRPEARLCVPHEEARERSHPAAAPS